MARGSNIITDGLTGNLAGLTFVRSRRYGPHVRGKRGTIKPARINEAMKKSSLRLSLSNVPAKSIFDAVRGFHKDGELWNKLCVIFRRQLKAGQPFDIEGLKDLECHEKNTLHKLMSCTAYQINHASPENDLHVELLMKSHPDWSFLEWKHVFQYRLSVVAVFPDFKTGHYEREVIHGPITAFSDPVQPLLFDVPTPDNASDYVLFLFATVCNGGEVQTVPHVKGMGVVGMGHL